MLSVFHVVTKCPAAVSDTVNVVHAVGADATQIVCVPVPRLLLGVNDQAPAQSDVVVPIVPAVPVKVTKLVAIALAPAITG